MDVERKEEEADDVGGDVAEAVDREVAGKRPQAGEHGSV